MSQDAQTLGVESRYEVIETIGQGAAATVHKVRDRRDGAVKAAKLLRLEQVETPKIVRRFEDEFRILRGLHHPSLPEVYDYGWTQDESRYIVMEFVDGQPLDQYLQQEPDDLWVILYELCEVLSFIHSHNLLHQDIKPGNILVKRTAAFGDEMPLVVLIDFGLTFRRDADQNVAMVGTPAYMAPEIIRGESPLTRAVDYYSLGVTLYQLIVGHLPFQGSGRQILGGHLNQEVRFDREKIEYAELYPHIRGLMTKDRQARLSAFEDFRRSVIGRMTGGIEELEQAYGLAHINSLGMIGKNEAWKELMEWLEAIANRSGGTMRGPEATVVSTSDENQIADGLLDDIGAPDTADEEPQKSVSPVTNHLIAMISGAPGSGKSYLIDRACAEMSLQGLTALGIDEALHGASTAATPAATRYIDAWSEIQRIAEPRGVVIVVDDADLLEESSREFLVYLLRRSNIAKASGEESRLHFLVATAVMESEETYQEANRLGERISELRLRPLQPDDHERLLAEFRTRILERRDAANLLEFVGRVAHNAADVCDGLRTALLDGSARLHGGRWRFQLADDSAVGGSDEYYGKLVTHLSGTERQLLFATACHRGPVAVGLVCEILQLDPQELPQRAHRLYELGLLQLVDGGRSITFPTEGLRERIYSGVPPPNRDENHRRFSRYVGEALENTQLPDDEAAPLAEQQSFHLAALGEHREALRYLFRALECWAREDDIFGVRRIGRRCVELCSAHDGELSMSGSARLLKRYAVKTLLNAEWRQSNLHRIRDVVEREYVSVGQDVPVSFVPKYARALQAAGSLAEARVLLQDGLKRVNKPDAVPSLRMRIELSLVLQQASEIQESLDVLDGVSAHLSRLDDYYRCRVFLHYAICYEALADHGRALEMAKSAERWADRRGFVYEITIVHQIRVNVHFDCQELSKAMSQIAVGVRFAGKHGQYRSLGWLYFQASGIYYSMGAYDRCLSYLHKALTLAERLGDARNAVTYLTRFGMTYQSLGLYGNALRFLDRAQSAGGTTLRREDQAKLDLVRLDISLDLNLSDLDALQAEIDALAEDQLGKHQEGYCRLLRGRYYDRKTQYDRARASFEAARDSYVGSSIVDDAVLASGILAMFCLRTGDRRRFASLMAYLDEEISKVESENVRAVHECAKLEEVLCLATSPSNSLLLAEHSESQRSRVTDTPTQLLLDQRLFRVWARLGRREEARVAFARFHQTVKRIVANLPDRALANQFLSRLDVASVLREYRTWEEQQENARS